MYYLNNTHGNLPIASPFCISYCKIKFVVLSVLVLPQDNNKLSFTLVSSSSSLLTLVDLRPTNPKVIPQTSLKSS